MLAPFMLKQRDNQRLRFAERWLDFSSHKEHSLPLSIPHVLLHTDSLIEHECAIREGDATTVGVVWSHFSPNLPLQLEFSGTHYPMLAT